MGGLFSTEKTEEEKEIDNLIEQLSRQSGSGYVTPSVTPPVTPPVTPGHIARSLIPPPPPQKPRLPTIHAGSTPESSPTNTPQNTPPTQSYIRPLFKNRITPTECTGELCGICGEKFEEDEKCYKVCPRKEQTCKSIYHYRCLLGWTARTCPTCRADWTFGKRKRKKSRKPKRRSRRKARQINV